MSANLDAARSANSQDSRSGAAAGAAVHANRAAHRADPGTLGLALACGLSRFFSEYRDTSLRTETRFCASWCCRWSRPIPISWPPPICAAARTAIHVTVAIVIAVAGVTAASLVAVRLLKGLY